tara:strand:- start:21073 stop:21432 length:360 start_codon:yes stop_codon:yes gene_type:complete
MDKQSSDYLNQMEEQFAVLGKQKIVKNRKFKGWYVTAYFGPAPNVAGGVKCLEFSASATTENKNASEEPDLSKGGAMRVDFDQKSVIWWSGGNLEELTKKIEETFPGYSWEEEENVNVG